MSNPLPSCFANFGKPAAPHTCDACPFSINCRGVIPVSQLGDVIKAIKATEAKLDEIQRVAKGRAAA